MANEFTHVSWASPISMFVPRPFQEVEKIGMRNQQNNAAFKSDMSELSDMFHIKSDTRQRGQAQSLMNHYNSQMNDLTDEYTKKGITPETAGKFDRLKRNFLTD